MALFTGIANRIRHFRSMRNKTQVTLSSDASIDYRHFQKLEAGKSDFKVSTIFKLSEALEIPHCALLQADHFDGTASIAEKCGSGVINRLEVGLVAWGTEGQLLFINNRGADILGLGSPKEALKSFNLKNLIPTLEPSLNRQNYVQAVLAGQIKSDFVRVQVKLPSDGRTKAIMAHWSRIEEARKDGSVRGFAAIVWDEVAHKDLSDLPAKTSGPGL